MSVFCGVSLENPERLKALKARHAAIEAQIEQERGAPSASDVFLKTLKKKKLFLKERIEGIRSGAM